ncbi:DMT family transporter [Caldimonas caldifontis]|uniref:EamA family transporter n=1 Tax=Caldimonas caldifontis TaxID=1452508 RepID=A0A2S5SWG6_9BURK|nr:DMT family transporter [Caldimonas caldifontis]PPE67074.1 EamA family transporter [Caldimonas caldifontis]
MNAWGQGALLRAAPWVFVLIWSTGFVVARYGMPHAPPMSFLAWRFAFSVLGLVLWARWAGARWPTTRSQWGHLAVVGVLLHAGYLGGVWAAVKAGMGAGLVALIVGLQPVLTAVWVSAVDRLGEGRVSLRQWAGLGLGFAGLVMVVWDKLGVGEAGPVSLALALWALLAITAGTLYQKRHVVAGDPRTGNAVQLMAALAVAAPLAWLEAEPIVLHPHFIGAMAWSVLVLTLGGNSLMYLLIQRGAATAFTSLLYLVPPCTAVLAWLLFGETLTALALVGMGIVAWGVWLVVRSQGGSASHPTR